MSTPAGFEHVIANRVGSKFVNVGDTLCESERIGIEPTNNFGLVSVRPSTSGEGMEARLTIYKHDEGRGTVSRAFTDRSVPGAGG
jgi:hypothetical protein